MTSIAVVIVNHNTCQHLQACLASIEREAPSEVVVVDNASSDGSTQMVRAEYPWVTLHANRTNPGYGAAANQGIASCTAQYVLLLNSDTLLQLGALEALSSYLDQHTRAAIVGPRLVNPDGTLQASCYPFPTPFHTLLENSTCAILLGRLIRRYIPAFRSLYLRTWPHTYRRIVPWVKGAAVAIRREAFDAVGGFDESFFMYLEDTDLCYRLQSAGWKVHFAPVTTVVHTGSASTAQYRADMAVQLLASTVQFYRRHSSTIRLAEMVMIVKSLMLVKWIVGNLSLSFTRDARKRYVIAADIAASQRVLLGHWERQGNRPCETSMNAPLSPLNKNSTAICSSNPTCE